MEIFDGAFRKKSDQLFMKKNRNSENFIRLQSEQFKY